MLLSLACFDMKCTFQLPRCIAPLLKPVPIDFFMATKPCCTHCDALPHDLNLWLTAVSESQLENPKLVNLGAMIFLSFLHVLAEKCVGHGEKSEPSPFKFGRPLFWLKKVHLRTKTLCWGCSLTCCIFDRVLA